MFMPFWEMIQFLGKSSCKQKKSTGEQPPTGESPCAPISSLNRRMVETETLATAPKRKAAAST